MSEGSETEEYLLNLTRQSLAALEDPNTPLSMVIRSAIRIARLQNDYGNVWWLELEMQDHEDERARQRLINEVYRHIPSQNFKSVQSAITEDYISERSVYRDPNNLAGEPDVWGQSVDQTELLLGKLRRDSDELWKTQHSKLAADAEFHVYQFETILKRIRHRIYGYLTFVEQHTVLARRDANIFQQYQTYVDGQLAAIAPEILDQLHHAYDQAHKGTREAYSQAALSCRRAIKSLADLVYPPKSEPYN